MRHASRRVLPPIELRHAIATHFKPGHAALRDAGAPLDLMLPVTTPPAQIPRIASAGVALTPPYHRNETYSATEPRRRLQKNLQMTTLPEAGVLEEQVARLKEEKDFRQKPGPLSVALGHHRILRTSPLTEVPFVCCPDP